MNTLTFIEQHFTNYFNQESQLPRAYYKSSLKALENQFLTLSELSKEKKLPSHFIEVLMIPYHEFKKSKGKTTFQKLIYCKTYLKEVLEVLQSKYGGIKLEKFIIESLIYINFNSYHFYSYIANRLTAHYQQRTNFNDQLDSLQLFQKLINQSQVKPGFHYNHQADSIKNKLSKWVAEEISYFTKKRQTEIQFTNLLLNDKEPKQTEKLVCNLSVSQLAYGMSLLVKANIVEPKSTADLINFTSNNFTSKNQKSISKNSLRNKFYAVESSTVDQLTELMENLIELSQHDKSNL